MKRFGRSRRGARPADEPGPGHQPLRAAHAIATELEADLADDLRQIAALHWVGRIYLGFAAILLPWTAYLALSLPQRSLSLHYAGTWTGFDIALMLVLARVGWFAYHRDPRAVLSAVAASAMLITDAWFDVTTAASGSAWIQAVLSALLLELPTAALSALLARRGLAALVSRAAAAAAAGASAVSPDPPATTQT